MTVPSTMADLSVSASSNSPNGSVDLPSALDDNIRAVAAIVRRTQARGAAIASASTVNLGATTDGEFVHITGTTTISSFGTVAAGVERTLVFDGALTLTHSSNLLCPYLTSFTTTAGDVMTWRSEGLGVWKCVSHLPASSSSERNRLGLGTAVQAGDYNTSVAGGTADAITGDYTPNVLALENGLTLFVRAAAANATTAPTFAPDGLAAKTIVKGNNLALAAGDIAGAGHWLEMNFDAALDKWVLQNPYASVAFASSAETQSGIETAKAVTPKGLADSMLSGAGQTWQNVTGSRAINTTYTNTTGRPIFVAIQTVLTANIASTAWLVVNGVNVGYAGGNGVGANQSNYLYFVVPPGGTYKLNTVSGISGFNWAELR